MDRFYSYKNYLIDRYQEKTYKLPIQIPVTCPNRDGSIGVKGCYFCSDQGTGFESLDKMTPISDQLAASKEKVAKRYKAKKFIGYFQNYTNTYLPINTLIDYLKEAAEFELVGIDIATRPDSIPDGYLEEIAKFSKENNIDITFEIGLQIANDRILEEINRGHDVDAFVQSVLKIKSFGFAVCTHLIINLPESTMEDVVTTVELMNELDVDIVKLHSLYIAKDSVFGEMYINDELSLCSYEEYVERVVSFICKLKPTIALSRLVSRIPEEDGLFSNWGCSWWKIYNDIINQLEEKSLYQGIDYEHK
jgi:hypothetical protein